MIYYWQDTKESKKNGWEIFERSYFEHFDQKIHDLAKKCDIAIWFELYLNSRYFFNPVNVAEIVNKTNG